MLSIRSGVGYLQQAKAGGFEQAFIFARRTEKVVADGAASCDFLMRDDAANDESVAEKNAGIRFEHAKEFVEQSLASRYVAEDVVRKSAVEGGIGKRQLL